MPSKCSGKEKITFEDSRPLHFVTLSPPTTKPYCKREQVPHCVNTCVNTSIAVLTPPVLTPDSVCQHCPLKGFFCVNVKTEALAVLPRHKNATWVAVHARSEAGLPSTRTADICARTSRLHQRSRAPRIVLPLLNPRTVSPIIALRVR